MVLVVGATLRLVPVTRPGLGLLSAVIVKVSASLADQASMEEPPCVMVAGVAVNDAITGAGSGGGGSVTVTLTLPALPLLPDSATLRMPVMK